MADEALRRCVNHLRYLGYRAEVRDDGWTLMTHPVRCEFYLRAFPFGIRAVALFAFEDFMYGPEWLAFVNHCNACSAVASFHVISHDPDRNALRSVVIFPLTYSRSDFGVWMEAWQKDLELLGDAPVPEPDEAPVVTH